MNSKILAILVVFAFCGTLFAQRRYGPSYTALIAIADGTEETEFVAVYDVLSRLPIEITIASGNTNGNLKIKAANGLPLLASTTLDEALRSTYSIIVVPGGHNGAVTLGENQKLVSALRRQKAEGRWIAAVCAASALVLGKNGLLDGEKGTTYPNPDYQKYIKDHSRINDRVVISNKVITSQAPGTSLEWGLAIVSKLFDSNTADYWRRRFVV
eukprot:TRINITY_DN1115_c0_g1_i5.p1 TRINITY_DN1115_c0_g1~~TRINITY_DN1115_c0_g1_i5.p1  ORF type:complete len:213 (-),score=70.05 TRINITY_DN1115_c0_g1_i5:97-735(-)